MKKLTVMLLAILMLTVMVGGVIGAGAETEPVVTVYVTIVDGSGNLALAMKSVSVPDPDGNGTATLDEVLFRAHEQFYEGGAQAGYASSVGPHGLALDMLWGVNNGGAYMYYVNHASAMNLNDTAKEGDVVAAFVYTDTATWSDTYCFFDQDLILFDGDGGVNVTLTLKAISLEGGPLPVVGAVITMDGEWTESVTDADGKATFLLPAGWHVISAVSDSQKLVPPVCLADGGLDAEIVDDPLPAPVEKDPTPAEKDPTPVKPDEPKADEDFFTKGVTPIAVIVIALIAVILTDAICTVQERKYR